MNEPSHQNCSLRALQRKRAACSFAARVLRTGARCYASLSFFVGLSAVRTAVERAAFGPRLIVLAYHRVNDSPSDPSPYTVTSEQFGEQLTCVKRRFPVIGFREALALHGTSGGAPDAVVITLDDGYRDNFTNAAPILRRHGLTACFFLPSDLLAPALSPPAPSSDAEHLRRMAVDEAKALSEMGFELGAHTRTHRNLARIPPADARREIEASKLELQDRLGVSIEYFAYPGGKKGLHYNDELKNIVAEHYRVCCTTTRGRNSIRTMDMLEVHRICVQSWWSRFQFGRELDGTFDFLGSVVMHRH